MKPARLLPLLLILVVSALPIAGQEAAGTAPAPQQGLVCIVFPSRDLSASDDSRDYEQTITEAVSASFEASGFRMLPPSSWEGAAAGLSVDLAGPVSQPDALAVARSVGADLAVTSLYAVQDEEIYYSIQCWDVTQGKLAAGLQARTPFNLAFFSQLNLALASDLIPRLAPQAAAVPPRVVFTSRDEGMDVKVSGDQDIGQVMDGRLSLPATSIVPGAKVTLRKSKPGFHSAEQTVTLAVGKDIPLKPLVRESRYGVELNSTLGQLLGLGVAVRDYRVPDWFFITVGGYLWVQPPLNFAPRAVLHTDLFGGIGGYLFLDPSAPVRLGVSTGAGLVASFFTTPGLPGFVDFYLDVVNWWLEATLFGTTLYVRQEYKYALGIGANNLLGRGLLLPGFPPTTLGVLFRW